MRVLVDIRKSVDQNASDYFEKAKKDRKKLDGARKITLEYDELLKKEQDKVLVRTLPLKRSKQEWYEKFRWFFSSDGFLVIGGRDATTNEMIIKKYTQEGDLVFHTDMAGSPFVVVKSDGKKIPQSTLEEASVFTAVFSRGWKQGLSTLAVFCVNPDQVSKQPNPGEFLTKGAFVIRGKVNYFSPQMSYGICFKDGKIMGAPLSVVRKYEKFLEIIPGDDKLSDVAKSVRAKIGGDLDEILRSLPASCKIKS